MREHFRCAPDALSVAAEDLACGLVHDEGRRCKRRGQESNSHHRRPSKPLRPLDLRSGLRRGGRAGAATSTQPDREERHRARANRA
jgi:hypothetical protein